VFHFGERLAKIAQMDKTYLYRVRYGNSYQAVTARSAAEAIESVRNEYEAEWGVGAFDQYDVSTEVEEVDE